MPLQFPLDGEHVFLTPLVVSSPQDFPLARALLNSSVQGCHLSQVVVTYKRVSQQLVVAVVRLTGIMSYEQQTTLSVSVEN